MALNKAMEVSDNELEKVAGGLTISNQGHPDTYKVGMNGCDFAYTYDASRQDEVIAILSNLNYSDCQTIADKERKRLEALKAVPGLLTAIPGADPSAY